MSLSSGVALSILFKRILALLLEDKDSKTMDVGVSVYVSASTESSASVFEDGDREYRLAKALLMNDSKSVFRGAWRSRSRCVA